MSPEEMAKASGGSAGDVPGDSVDSPPPSRPAAQTPAASRAARPAAAPNSRPAQPSTGAVVAGEGDNLPVSPSPNPAVAKNAPTRPSAGSNVASEGDDFDAPSAQAANNAAATPSPPQAAAPSNVASDEGPTGTTPASGGSAIAGGKGAAQPNTAGGGAGIAGGKGGAAAQAAPSSATVVETGPLSLLDQAAKSFDTFKEFDASQHLYAHWLTDPGAMDEYPLQWVTGISEPRLFFRWGVGVVYDAPTDFSDQPPLIGDPVATTTPAAGRGGRNGRGGVGAGLNESAPTGAAASPYAGVDQTTPFGNLLFYTGDFGERLIKRLDSRRTHRDFFYGKMLSISKFKSPDIARATTTTTTLSTPGTQLSNRAVLLGDTVEGTSRTVTTNNARNTPNTSGVVATIGTLVPGVIFLGTESDSDAEKALLERGKSSGVDAVLIFYVTVKEKSRSDSAYSTTKLGVHNLKTGEKKETGSLSSETVAKTRQREKNSDNDPVELALDKVFNDYSDAKLRVSTMPEIKPEIAQKRAETIATENPSNPLPSVVEILSYHKTGLLDETATIAAIGKLIGGDEAARKLLSGTPDEKLAVVEKWLLGNSENPGQSSGEKFR